MNIIGSYMTANLTISLILIQATHEELRSAGYIPVITTADEPMYWMVN